MRLIPAAAWRPEAARVPGWLEDPELAARVDAIIARVRAAGDEALRELARELEGAALGPGELEVPRPALETAWRALDPGVQAALRDARARLEAFHRGQLPADRWVDLGNGIRAGELVRPLDRVALYVPGGRAAYPSTVLMLAVPARLAGVRELCLFTPPGPGGRVPDVTLAAAWLAGVDRVFRVGGAQAVAAAAFGTATVPACDAFCGPGGVWVTLAKLRLAGRIGVDLPAGPTELAVVADGDADPSLVAADLVCQAEHDPRARVAVFSPSRALLAAVRAELERQAAAQARREELAGSLAAAVGVWTRDLAEAVRLADAWAPEHLALHVPEPRLWLPEVRRAGLVLLGAAAAPAFADYVLGTNHVLPTGGAGRFASALGVRHFLRTVSAVEVDPAGAPKLVAATVALALAEGFPGHAACALRRAGAIAGAAAAASRNGTGTAGGSGPRGAAGAHRDLEEARP